MSVDIYERLPVPFGLVRSGVAPDHQKTKGAIQQFTSTLRRKGVRLFLNTEIGRDLTHDQLADWYDAVVYAVGAMGDRSLGIPGEDLPGSHSATEFVGWYNGHPDFADRTFDLSGERAVVLGNGNVALDVARVLVSDPDRLAKTDIADHALAALRESNIREVVVVGRRGVAQAAFTNPELLGLVSVEGVQVVADELEIRAADGEELTELQELKLRLVNELVTSESRNRRVVLRFLASPVEVLGGDSAEGVRLAANALALSDGRVVATPTGSTEDIEASLVLRSVGYRGRPMDALPFEAGRGVIPNEAGRVIDPETGTVLPGRYVVGWIKRGPSGVIGTNKQCAKETADAVIDDLLADRANRGGAGEDPALGLTEAVGFTGWRAIDEHERKAGAATGRPRTKLVHVEEMLGIARAAEPR